MKKVLKSLSIVVCTSILLCSTGCPNSKKDEKEKTKKTKKTESTSEEQQDTTDESDSVTEESVVEVTDSLPSDNTDGSESKVEIVPDEEKGKTLKLYKYNENSYYTELIQYDENGDESIRWHCNGINSVVEIYEDRSDEFLSITTVYIDDYTNGIDTEYYNGEDLERFLLTGYDYKTSFKERQEIETEYYANGEAAQITTTTYNSENEKSNVIIENYDEEGKFLKEEEYTYKDGIETLYRNLVKTVFQNDSGETVKAYTEIWYVAGTLKYHEYNEQGTVICYRVADYYPDSGEGESIEIRTINCEYDENERLISCWKYQSIPEVEEGYGEEDHWEYNEHGDLVHEYIISISELGTYNIERGTYTYEYNDFDKPIRIVKEYKESLSYIDTYEYEYDDNGNEITKVFTTECVDLSEEKQKKVWTSKYDEEGNRIERRMDNYHSFEYTVESWSYYD